MEGHQNVSSSTGPPELNRSYYAGNSLSALHSSQQVHEDSVSTSVHSQPTTQRLIDNTPSCSALGSQFLHRNTGSPALAGPTCNVTGEAMPISFGVALTQLSFLEFVQRCNVLAAPSQPTQLPASVSLTDVAVQTASPCEVSQDSSTQTSDQPVSSLSLDVAVQTIFRSICPSSLDAAVQTLLHSSLSQDVSTQFGSRTVSSFSVDASLQTSTHSVVQLDAATQLDLTEFLIGWIFSDSPLDRRHPLCQSPPSVLGSHVVPRPPPGFEQPVPSPATADHSQSLTVASSSSCPTQQPPVSTTHVETHPVRTASSAKRSASTAYAGTHTSNGTCSRTEAALFPKPKAVILPMVNFGHPLSNGSGPIATAISCIINFAFPSCSGIQARRAKILPILSLLPAVGSMQSFSRKPATMSRTSLITSEHTPTTRTLPFCSTRTPLSQTLLFSRSRLTLRAKILGAWCYSLFAPCSDVLPLLEHLQSHFVPYISTMLWPRNVTYPLIFSNSFTPKSWSTMSTS